MYKLVMFGMLMGLASAGYLSYTAPAVGIATGPAIGYAAAPLLAAAPTVGFTYTTQTHTHPTPPPTSAPVATSYANTYRVSNTVRTVSPAPVVQALGHPVVTAAPVAVTAAPIVAAAAYPFPGRGYTYTPH